MSNSCQPQLEGVNFTLGDAHLRCLVQIHRILYNQIVNVKITCACAARHEASNDVSLVYFLKRSSHFIQCQNYQIMLGFHVQEQGSESVIIEACQNLLQHPYIHFAFHFVFTVKCQRLSVSGQVLYAHNVKMYTIAHKGKHYSHDLNKTNDLKDASTKS